VPSESAGTSIYACYGDATVNTSQEHASGTWDANYQGVWHMTGSTGSSSTDSTANNYTGTDVGSTVAIAGEIDGARSFNGTSQGVNIGDKTNLKFTNNDFTVSTWFDITSATATSGKVIFGKGTPSAVSPYYLEYGANNTSTIDFRTGASGCATRLETYTQFKATTSINQWMSFVVTKQATSELMYRNGVAVTSFALSSSTICNNTQPATIGYNGTTYFFPGYVDEARLSNSARSPSWILTEYNNEKAPDAAQFTTTGFYTVGAQTALTTSTPSATLLVDALCFSSE
jgi:hypothetical protein